MKPSSMKRRFWLWGILVAAALALGWHLIRANAAEETSYQLAPVERGEIAVRISATGTLSAVTTVQVGSQISGTIAKLYADYNSVVRKGELLAQLDPTFLQAAVDVQKADVAKARAALDDSERSYKRTAQLFAKSLAAQADLDAATASLEAAKASLEAAQAGLKGAEVSLRYSTIRAPINGVVISRNVDVGQTVAASLQAPTLFTIANNLRKMQVQADIDEADIGNVNVGQPVSFTVDAYPERVFHGTVSQIRLAPVVTQNVVMYNVIIDVANPDLKLMPGMTATVSILVQDRKGVLRVPIQAIRFAPPGAQQEQPAASLNLPPGDGAGGGFPQETGMEDLARVFVLRNGKPTAVSFVRGLENMRYIEIRRSDLKAGEKVIVGITGGSGLAAGTSQTPFGLRRSGGERRRAF
jgi:HlyD family secretion protein